MVKAALSRAEERRVRGWGFRGRLVGSARNSYVWSMVCSVRKCED